MSRWLIIGLYQELLLVSSSRKKMNSNTLNRKMRSWFKSIEVSRIKKEQNIVKGTICPRYGWLGLKIWERAGLLLCSGLKSKGKKSFPKIEMNFFALLKIFCIQTISFLEMTVLDPQKEGSIHCRQMEVAELMWFTLFSLVIFLAKSSG